MCNEMRLETEGFGRITTHASTIKKSKVQMCVKRDETRDGRIWTYYFRSTVSYKHYSTFFY
jgi:hypothetical protein